MSLSRVFSCTMLFVVALVVMTSGRVSMAADEKGAADAHGHAAVADPTHADASNQLYKAVDFREDMAIFTAVVFLLLLVGLYFAAWKPIMEGLEKREHTIAGNIKAAEQANADAQAKLKEYESRLAAASEEATRIVAEARKGAEAAATRIEAEAQDEAARIRERSVAEIDAAKRVALGELAAKSTDVAMALATRIVGREVKAADHQKLIQDMLAQLPSKN